MAITKDILCGALMTTKEYSSFSLSKLMRNKKDDLIKMYEEIGGDLNDLDSKSKMVKVLSMTDDTSQSFGMTFSKNDYDTYQEKKDRNIFEEIIDNLMIDKIVSNKIKDETGFLKPGTEEHEKACKEIIDFINDRKEHKRTKILKFLSEQNSVYINIINIIKKRESKFSYIKDIIKELREYVKVGKTETKLFGEVMTPLTLVSEMMDKLPDEVYYNPNLKWLDNCNGCGAFPAYVIYRLMVGLREWQPDEDLRYKHIIENMIYVAELQPTNMFLWLFTIDPRMELDTNIYCGSFLDEGFDYHMKNVWEVKKFDFIIGNPPYQELSTSELKSSDQGRIKLWMKFINKSLLITDYLLYLSPNNWLSNTCYLNEIFKQKLIFSQIDNDYLKNTYFKKIGSTFSYFLLHNNNNLLPKFFTEKNEINFNIFDIGLLPTKEINYNSISIFKKVQTKCNITINFTREKYNLITNKDLLISIDRSKNKGFTIYEEGLEKTSSYWYICSTKEELEILKYNLNTKLYKFLIKNIRSGMAIVSTINTIPIIRDKKYTDLEMKNYFNLNQEEFDIL